jgi:hypothetical protein
MGVFSINSFEISTTLEGRGGGGEERQRLHFFKIFLLSNLDRAFAKMNSIDISLDVSIDIYPNIVNDKMSSTFRSNFLTLIKNTLIKYPSITSNLQKFNLAVNSIFNYLFSLENNPSDSLFFDTNNIQDLCIFYQQNFYVFSILIGSPELLLQSINNCQKITLKLLESS